MFVVLTTNQISRQEYLRCLPVGSLFTPEDGIYRRTLPNSANPTILVPEGVTKILTNTQSMQKKQFKMYMVQVSKES